MATNDRTAEEAEDALRSDIASVMTDPVTPEEVPVATEKEEGYEIYNATAKEAIGYIRKCENVSEIYDLIQKEEQGKGRKTIISEGMSRIQELNIMKEKAREDALAPSDTSGADAPEVAQTEKAIDEAPPEPMAEVGEYPIEDEPWEGEMGRYTELKHLSRTMHPMGGLDETVMSPRDLNDKLEDEYFAKGFELVKILPQGFGPDGVSVLYVLGKVREDLQPKHKEIWHIQRTLTERGGQTGAVTGFQADKYIKSFLSDGWQLFAVDTLKDGDVEIPMLWVLVR